MRMKSLGDDFVRAWWEKFYTLAISGKFILFWGTLAVTTCLLILKIIDANVWGKVIMVDISVVAGLRGAVEVAALIKRGKELKLVDTNEE